MRQDSGPDRHVVPGVARRTGWHWSSWRAKVWDVLKNTPADPGWMGVGVARAEPPGPLRPGQTLLLASSALGRRWQVTLVTEALDEEQGFVDMLVRLPLGITNHEHMTLSPVPSGACRVQFG